MISKLRTEPKAVEGGVATAPDVLVLIVLHRE
jgi:hypothetical protein